MKAPSEWKNEFQKRIQDAVNGHVGFDINKIVEELVEDVQEDMRWWKLQKKKRTKYGILSEEEAKSLNGKIDKINFGGKV